MNANEETKSPEKRIVRIKQSFNYNYVYDLLLCIRGYEIMHDKRFCELYQQLVEYVDSLVTVPDGLDVIDEYYLLECEIVDEAQYHTSVEKQKKVLPKTEGL